eukprot:Tamp_07615.p1 GENE.Tamp_07615~~Tamp_07615.p1  ORF type:complete len:452 (+),score=83.75 Tamp_07615:489-1844(+)
MGAAAPHAGPEGADGIGSRQVAGSNAAVRDGEGAQAGGKGGRGGFWPAQTLKRLLGQCSQPRPGVLERRERAERMFEEQRAAEAAVKMQAEARAVETAAAAASAAMTAPGAGGTDGVAESTMAGMPGATAAASSSGATAVSPAASGPLHSTSPGSKMRDMPGIPGMHGIQDMHGMQGKQGIAPVHARAPAGRSAHDPEVAAASEATPWEPSAQPEAAGAQEQWVQATAEGTQMVRGPGGQWRPKPAVGGGSGRPRTTPASVPSAGWCVGWRKPRKDGAAATATRDHGLIHERPHASAPDEALGLSNGSAWQHAGDAMAPPAGAPVAYGGAPQPAGAGGPRSLWAAPDGGADTAPVARGQKGAATRDVWNEFSVEAGEDDDEDDVNLVTVSMSVGNGQGQLERTIAATVLPAVAHQALLASAILRGDTVLLRGTPDSVQYAQDLLEAAGHSA